MNHRLTTDPYSPVTIEELAAALDLDESVIRRRAYRGDFGPSLIPGRHTYPAVALPSDVAERVEARREARKRAESVEELKGCVPVRPVLRSVLELSEKQRVEARARADLLLWVAGRCRDEGLTVRQALLKGRELALTDPTCRFKLLGATGKGRATQIKDGNYYRWLAKWRSHRRHEHDEYGWWCLADEEPLSRYERVGDERYWQHISLIYEGPNGIALGDAWEYAVKKGEQHGWGEAPTLRQVRYWYQLKADRLAVKARRSGGTFVYNTVDLAVRRDWSKMPFGSMWFSDHHMFNVFVRVPAPWAPGYWVAVRPWITQFLDCPTMHEVSSVIRARAGDGDVILQCWRRAVDTLGWSAETVAFDNGKDYRSIGGVRVKLKPLEEGEMTTTAEILGVRASFALAWNARTKPCEFDFSEVEQKFERRWPTYCGHNKEHMDMLWSALKAEKLATFGGDNNPYRGCLVNPDLVPTLDDFAAAYYDWRATEHETRSVDGIMLDGQTPAGAWAAGLACCQRPAIDAETRFVAFLRAFQKPQRVGRGGVVWFKQGDRQRDWIRYHSPALYDYLVSGEEVLVKVDTESLGQCYVFRHVEGHGWKLINCGGPNGGCPSVADIPANAGTDQVRDHQRYVRAQRKAMAAGVDAAARSAALEELARGEGVTEGEAALVHGAAGARPGKNGSGSARADRKKLFEGEGITDADLQAYDVGRTAGKSEQDAPTTLTAD